MPQLSQSSQTTSRDAEDSPNRERDSDSEIQLPPRPALYRGTHTYHELATALHNAEMVTVIARASGGCLAAATVIVDAVQSHDTPYHVKSVETVSEAHQSLESLPEGIVVLIGFPLPRLNHIELTDAFDTISDPGSSTDEDTTCSPDSPEDNTDDTQVQSESEPAEDEENPNEVSSRTGNRNERDTGSDDDSDSSDHDASLFTDGGSESQPVSVAFSLEEFSESRPVTAYIAARNAYPDDDINLQIALAGVFASPEVRWSRLNDAGNTNTSESSNGNRVDLFIEDFRNHADLSVYRGVPNPSGFVNKGLSQTISVRSALSGRVDYANELLGELSIPFELDRSVYATIADALENRLCLNGSETNSETLLEMVEADDSEPFVTVNGLGEVLVCAGTVSPGIAVQTALTRSLWDDVVEMWESQTDVIHDVLNREEWNQCHSDTGTVCWIENDYDVDSGVLADLQYRFEASVDGVLVGESVDGEGSEPVCVLVSESETTQSRIRRSAESNGGTVVQSGREMVVYGCPVEHLSEGYSSK